MIYQITIEINVGIYQHLEEFFFAGTYQEACEFSEKYLSTIWGPETEKVDDGYSCYYACASLYSIREYKSETIDTPNGKVLFEITFRVSDA